MGFRFHAYELLFESALACPGFRQGLTTDVSPDVQISLGIVPESLDCPTIAADYYQVSPQEFLLTITRVARYLVTSGNSIVVEPYPGADPDKVRLFLFGSALGALLYQRAFFPLHGCAVVTEYGAMIFVGPQGIGKSTLAAHFQRRGYQLLSDDVCAITQGTSGQLRVLSAFPQLRLCKDAFERLGNHIGITESARFDVDKFVLSLESGHCIESSPMCAIHLLSDHHQTKHILQPVSGFNRVRLLIENLYRPSYLRGLDSQGAVMLLATAIAQETVITEICRSRDHGRIDELIDCLELEWQRNTIYHKKGATCSGTSKLEIIVD